ncbi:Ig-like domain-containing protein [Methanosphaera sp. ISO3-F5]|uniref:Ig-like domain-containing protein n=1 Tax=Methanosphaera sp. ISO3-F5 TaxID=1452353 RepID=UPI002B25C129|nr:Ig-like domain-containing protein [Methanosphaera sp. ISO3-F5]WQH63439.1 Ig-like domain-containing protein [Methanosphaera sp. ISO3-F5]
MIKMINKKIKCVILLFIIILLLIGIVNATEVSDDGKTNTISKEKIVPIEKNITTTKQKMKNNIQEKKINKNKRDNSVKKEDNNSSNTTNTTKKKTAISLLLNKNKAAYMEDYKIYGYLKEIDENPISNETITLTVDEINYDLTTDKNGRFDLNMRVYDIWLKKYDDMNFHINASFKGNNLYYSSTNKTKLAITTFNTEIKIVKEKTRYMDNEPIKIKGSLRVADNGWGIANQTIELTLKYYDYPDSYEEYYSVKTDKNGVYTLTITPFRRGNYELEAYYNGTKKYMETYSIYYQFFVSSAIETTIKIYPYNNVSATQSKNDNLVCIGQIRDKYNKTVTNQNITKVRVYQNLDMGIENEDVLDIEKEVNITPDKNGEFIITIPYKELNNWSQKSNYYVIELISGETKKYMTSTTKKKYDFTKKSKITIENIPNIDFGKNIQIKGKASNNNKSIQNGTVKLLINNQIYTTKINKGTYNFTYKTTKTGLNNITAVYCGDSNNAPTSVKTTFNVKKNTNITLPALKQKIYKENITIIGKLKDTNGIIIKNATIKVKINTKTYTAKTSNKGVYTVKVVANKVGINNVTVTYAGNKYYKAVTKKTTFKTVARATKLTVNKISTKTKGKKVKITGKLTDSFKSPVINSLVKIKINKKTALVKTNKQGVYTYNYKTITKGTNTVTVTFVGSTNYKKTTAKTIFKVK